MKKILANLLSYIFKKPIFFKIGLTSDSNVKLNKIPNKPIVDKNSIVFFKIDPNLGIFEVEEILHDKKEIKYVITHLKTSSRFMMPKKWFDFFFIEVPNNIDQLDIFKEQKSE